MRSLPAGLRDEMSMRSFASFTSIQASSSQRITRRCEPPVRLSTIGAALGAGAAASAATFSTAGGGACVAALTLAVTCVCATGSTRFGSLFGAGATGAGGFGAARLDAAATCAGALCSRYHW